LAEAFEVASQTLGFQAEVKELLGLMIHSLYAHREVFLRELVSNASDALDKLRFEALRKPELAGAGWRPAIRIEVDREMRVLRVRDNGIGMTREEVAENLGTIARSGTRKFLEAAREQGTQLTSLIGQFGVGFYASFMVAEEIVVETRRAGESGGTRWSSRGDGTYTIDELPNAQPGTSVELRLKPPGPQDSGEEQDFTDPQLLRELVRRYSDFVEHPIEIEARLLGAGHGLKEETLADGARVAILNSLKPLWARPKEELKREDYVEFYRHLTHEWSEPLEVIHFKAEGASEYTALLYLPSERALDFFDPRQERSKISLYVRRVFVMAESEDVLPPWLRFVRGVIDAQDLPLNVSREVLQQNRALIQIRRRLTKKVLDTLGELRDARRGDYQRFFEQFGATLKEGIVTDPEQAEAIAAVCLFESSRPPEGGEPARRTTLEEYLARRPKDQTAIYYLLAEDREAAARSPHLEALRARKREVLFLTDPVDEWLAQRLREYKGSPLQAVDRGGALEESEERRLEREQKERELRALLEDLEQRLKGRVEGVRLSSRLTESVAVLVDDEHALGAHMERLLRQTQRDAPKRKRFLELNPSHSLVERLAGLHASDPRSKRYGEYAELVYAQALLAEGSPLPNPQEFGRMLTDLMVGPGAAETPPPDDASAGAETRI
jgi:molecular chaperone HtpG